MTSRFPKVDRNRLVSNASKQLLGVAVPATWHLVDIGGDTDFGFDLLVQVAVDDGVQHVFLLQLKGTESPTFIANGATLSYPLRRRTLNLYANVVPDVMLVVAAVTLDDHGKLLTSSSKIYWQWMSKELKNKRGGAFVLDQSDGETSVHLPADQVLDPSLDVLQHLEELRDVVRAGMTLEDLLQQAHSLGQTSRQSFISKLADLANQKPKEFTALLQSGTFGLSASLPPEAHAIRALIRSGSTELAEAALDKLGPDGLGSSTSQRAAFLSLRGKVLVHRRLRADAIQLFKQAYALDGSVEHLLPLAEMRFLGAVDDPIDLEGIAAVRDSLSGADTDDALSLRVRVHTALKEFSLAQACLDRISSTAQLMPRLVLLTAQHQWSEAVELTLVAKATGGLSIADLTSAQLVAARAAWCGATQDVGPLQEPGELPLAGAVGTKLDLARQSWTLAFDALKGLRSLAWPPNVELLAPVVCGVAGLLGHQNDALALLSEAAARRPEYPELQLHTELLSIKADKPELALTANLRQTDSMDVLTRRTSLLFELRRFGECQATALAVARSHEAPSNRAPMALAMGYAAAHRLGQLVEAAVLKGALESRPEWDEYTYFAEFARQGTLQPRSKGSLGALRAGLAKHPNSWLLAANLYTNIVVSDEGLAFEAVGLAKVLRAKAMLTADEAVHLVAAHTALKNWHDAAAEAASALQRFDADDRLLGMGAVAEEMLGRTGAAFALLERALAVGTKRISAVHNYMGLSLRLGRIDAVRSAIDRLLGLVTDQHERLELMRLSVLVYVQQGRLADALAAVEGLGQLVDQADEGQEGIFLNVFMAATMNGALPGESFNVQVEQRMVAFRATWPESNLFRRIFLPDNEQGTLSVHELLDPLIGDSRAQQREFELRERHAKQGELSVPFTLRPGFVFHYISDPFQLWDVAMRSRPEEQQFHLTMVQGDEFKSPNPARDIPLLDLSALLVLDSLDLFDKLFTVFGHVAIPSVTVGFLSQHANGVLVGGRSAERAKSILERVNHWMERIEQPSAGLAPKKSVLSSLDVWSDYSELAKRGIWLSYCDDAICRALIHADAPTAHFCTTIDALDLLDVAEELTEYEIATKLASLAKWNVSITVSDRFLIASLVNAWTDGKPGDASKRADAFRDHEMFATLSRAIWNPGKGIPDLVNHMAHMLHSMLQNPASDVDSAAAVLANWFNRVRLLKQADGLGWKLLCYPVLLAIKSMLDDACCRLISVLRRAVAASVAEQEMSVSLETEVTDDLGAVVGSITRRDAATADDLLRKLRIAMPIGTADGDRLIHSYFVETRRS